MKEIEISSKHGLFKVQVDDEDFDWLTQYRWHVCRMGKNYYARVHHGSRSMQMHRMILNHHGRLNGSEIVDHRDHNGLNNQKHNLRPCTHSQNGANLLPKDGSDTTSTYRGVTIHATGRWYARVKVNQRYRCVGVFDTERNAAIAYDIEARGAFGEFACPNIPDASLEEVERVTRLIRNPKRRLRTTSQYLGVFYCARTGKWGFNAFYAGQNKQRSGFATEYEAAQARDRFIAEYNLPVQRSLAA